MPEARIALMAELLTSVTCAICHRPVRLEECKADDFGRRVHEMCFAEWMIEDQKKETRKQTSLPSCTGWLPEVPCVLPAPTPLAAPTEIARSHEEIEIEILDYQTVPAARIGSIGLRSAKLG